MAEMPSKSFGAAVLHMFEGWSTQVFVYITTLLTATAVALILDLRYGLPPGRVLLYVLPLTALLLFLVPAAYVVLRNTQALKNAAYLRTLLTASSLDPLWSHSLKAVWNRSAAEKADHVADLIAAVNSELERLRETTATDESRNIHQQLKDAKRNLTLIRFSQLDLRLRQSGFTPGFRAVLNEVLGGVRDLAERDEACLPEHLREGFQKGVDEASAAIFDRVAVILAHQTFLANRQNYPPQHEDITLSRLAEQERLWLFKHEQQP